MLEVLEDELTDYAKEELKKNNILDAVMEFLTSEDQIINIDMADINGFLENSHIVSYYLSDSLEINKDNFHIVSDDTPVEAIILVKGSDYCLGDITTLVDKIIDLIGNMPPLLGLRMSESDGILVMTKAKNDDVKNMELAYQIAKYGAEKGALSLSLIQSYFSIPFIRTTKIVKILKEKGIIDKEHGQMIVLKSIEEIDDIFQE